MLDLLLAVGAEQQNRTLRDFVGEELDQFQGRGIRPLQVVHHEDLGVAILGNAVQEARDAVEEPEALLLRLNRRRLR